MIDRDLLFNFSAMEVVRDLLKIYSITDIPDRYTLIDEQIAFVKLQVPISSAVDLEQK